MIGRLAKSKEIAIGRIEDEDGWMVQVNTDDPTKFTFMCPECFVTVLEEIAECA